jgi:hypothetical protein
MPQTPLATLLPRAGTLMVAMHQALDGDRLSALRRGSLGVAMLFGSVMLARELHALLTTWP